MIHPFKLTQNQLINEINDRLEQLKRAKISLSSPELLIELYGLKYEPCEICRSVLDDEILCFNVRDLRQRYIQSFYIAETQEESTSPYTRSFAHSYLISLRAFCDDHNITL